MKTGQTAHMCRLIRVFSEHTCSLVGNGVSQLIYVLEYCYVLKFENFLSLQEPRKKKRRKERKKRKDQDVLKVPRARNHSSNRRKNQSL